MLVLPAALFHAIMRRRMSAIIFTVFLHCSWRNGADSLQEKSRLLQRRLFAFPLFRSCLITLMIITFFRGSWLLEWDLTFHAQGSAETMTGLWHHSNGICVRVLLSILTVAPARLFNIEIFRWSLSDPDLRNWSLLAICLELAWLFLATCSEGSIYVGLSQLPFVLFFLIFLSALCG